MGSGEKFEKNVTAIPRQFGYLETGRAMYEYAFYKDEEVAHARGLSTSAILGAIAVVTVVIPFWRWLSLGAGKAKEE